MATERQKKVIKHLSSNVGSTKEAMLKAGYSASYARTPSHLKKTKSFRKLLDKLIPEKSIVATHKLLLKKKEVFSTKNGLEYTDQPHSDVKGAVDMAYKLRGSYSPEQIEVHNPLEKRTDEELEAIYLRLKGKESSANTSRKGSKKRSNKRTGKQKNQRKV